jgi:hypothetical protein
MRRIVYNQVVKMRTIWGLFVALLVILLIIRPGDVTAQTDGSRYFPETGHWVNGEFLRAYESVADPLLVYGYPITGAFQSQSCAQYPCLYVQYFDHVRFEQHPENPPESHIIISSLGYYQHAIDGTAAVAAIPSNSNACRFIAQDDIDPIPVCYAFLKFFDSNGGILQFGYPISQVEVRGGRLVQYFDRARFEWHPENPSGQRVTLTDLGKIYFSETEDPRYLLPNQDDNAATILSLQVHAFVSQAVIPILGTQTLYVVVQDQNLISVPNAQVIVDIQYPSGYTESYIMPNLTDEHGLASMTFLVLEEGIGTAVIHLRVDLAPLHTTTVTSFRIWW